MSALALLLVKQTSASNEISFRACVWWLYAAAKSSPILTVHIHCVPYVNLRSRDSRSASQSSLVNVIYSI